jgi:hypothetical protein
VIEAVMGIPAIDRANVFKQTYQYQYQAILFASNIVTQHKNYKTT